MGKLIDKLLFGITLIFALQVPQLAEHYQQFLSGLYQSTKWQVEGYQATAKKHDYASVSAMIELHLQNELASVRTDAQQKKATLIQYQQLTEGMAVFEQGNLLQQSFYMFQPTRYKQLEATLTNFTPGIPLTLNGIAFGVVIGLLLNFILSLPFLLLFSLLVKKRKLTPQL